MDSNVCVLTEQGYPAGSFGCNPVTEEEKKNLEKKKEEKEDSDKK